MVISNQHDCKNAIAPRADYVDPVFGNWQGSAGSGRVNNLCVFVTEEGVIEICVGPP